MYLSNIYWLHIPPHNMTNILPWSTSELALIRNKIAKDCPDDELLFFAKFCQSKKLDPFAGDIFYVPRKNQGVVKWTIQTSVDGLRKVASRTGEYAGIDDAIFGKDVDGFPELATVTVYRIVQGQKCSFTATARWKEYYPGESLGFMWRSKPHIMLAKCAEALALRKGFPETGGIYTDEEMQKAVDSVKNDLSSEMKIVLIEKMDNCVSIKDLEELNKEISQKMSKLSNDDKRAIIEYYKQSKEKFIVETHD